MRFTEKSLGTPAHSDVLTIMGDLGIVGLVAFTGFHLCLFRRIMRLTDQWRKMFCSMAWCFIIFVGMTQTDYNRKYYGLAIALILAMVRSEEAEMQQVEEHLLMEAAPA
ncbi:MAG: hypothetical protein KAV87_09010, partial [Desulfobacteraceae bacterium]|nr:hypothetical protein [Desulfobacteraceae bacterium]